jgi:hypothetical protein
MLTPKTKKSPESAIHQYLPFLQLDPKTATLADFFSAGNGCILPDLVESPKGQAHSLIKKAIKGHETKALKYLRETLTNIQKMIFIATVQHKIPATELQTLANSFIEPSFSKCSFLINWSRPGNANIIPLQSSQQKHDNWEEHFNNFRCWLIWCVTEVFHSYEGSSLFDSLRFSACPTCQKIFEKKRKDQIFCSLPCGNLARVRKRREKAKNS